MIASFARPRRPLRRATTAAVPAFCLLGALASGCSTFGGSAPSADEADASAIVDDFPRSRRVAADFVEAMSALPELVPGTTTLYATRPPSRFGGLLVGALQNAGYDLRLGTDGSPITLDYGVHVDADAKAAEGGLGRYTFHVIADGVRLERSYAADVAGIRPASAMRVDGRALPATAPAAVLSAVPRALPVMAEPVPAVEPAPPPPKVNLFETRRSNYADLLVRFDTVRQDIMVFPNDSLVMGRDNKRLARHIADAFDPERDVISVIGCSHGRTAIRNGNETLANGRAYRVKEAFVLAGIDPERVLEEGCWAGTHFDKMPARGVVVTHKRRAAG